MYLLACVVVMWATLMQLLSRVVSLDAKSKAVGLLYMVAALMAAAPLLTTFYDAFLVESGKNLSMSSGRASVWVALGGSVLLAVLLLTQVVEARRSRSGIGFWRMGGMVVFGVAVLELGVAAAKQASFADDRAGMLNFEFFREQVPEIKCGSDVVLARFEKREVPAVAYRCPTLFLLNRFSTTPFVPWPDYQEGVSKDLGKAIDDMQRRMDMDNPQER